MHAKLYCETSKSWDTGCKVWWGDEGCLAGGFPKTSSSLGLRLVTPTQDIVLPARPEVHPACHVSEVHQKLLHHTAVLSAPHKTYPIENHTYLSPHLPSAHGGKNAGKQVSKTII